MEDQYQIKKSPFSNTENIHPTLVYIWDGFKNSWLHLIMGVEESMSTLIFGVKFSGWESKLKHKIPKIKIQVYTKFFISSISHLAEKEVNI